MQFESDERKFIKYLLQPFQLIEELVFAGFRGVTIPISEAYLFPGNVGWLLARIQIFEGFDDLSFGEWLAIPRKMHTKAVASFLPSFI
ncbi:hypothetical protein GCM10007423_58390 [Dyadobacter endophyticus]|uniref:Uncharacterized protein n=1 Tax=Dyadobacter endophyticus TaxID=1749036 RepID=A0ABQ1ZAP7_9BACT|nr:hypothetical protein [Dyadobacter endophyticus]GGH53189.1 hypothetical protein GCM10007423_58390 [Dyadobacter endophyticus]